jgi:MGT family glycosyltransferase
MAHFGIISPPVPGHMNPFSALGRELRRCGHRVTVFHMRDLESRVLSEGLNFHSIGEADHPPGTLDRTLEIIGGLSGFSATRFTISAAALSTRMFCRDLPAALQTAGIEALLVDQMEPAGGSVAEYLGIPFITVCNALALNREAGVPPPFSPWMYKKGSLAAVRNRIGYFASRMFLRPITKIVNEYRKTWGLRPHRSPDESFSKLAQISQQVAAFDFPRKNLPAHFHYVGPMRNASPVPCDFPWERLDGRPLVYASLGSLQGGRTSMLRCFAAACSALDMQAVISHGGALACNGADWPGSPVVVSFAPQLDVLSHAKLALSHAGLNTALDCLAIGVPIVAVPITYEQPGIAQRIVWSGCGIALDPQRLTVTVLARAMERVLCDPSYMTALGLMQKGIRDAGGVTRAAQIIQHATGTVASITVSPPA